MQEEYSHEYDDIIDLPHHVSRTHPQMSMMNRAAQFSPFAALTGYEEAVEETARLTEERSELDEAEKERLNAKLQVIKEHLQESPQATITYFVRDERKDGGASVSFTGIVRRIDLYRRIVQMEGDTDIPIDDILAIELS